VTVSTVGGPQGAGESGTGSQSSADSVLPTPSTGRRKNGLRKGDRKEAAILDTAWRLLGEKPAAAITVDELAAGAAISRSSFYFYFDSRDAVVRAVADRTAQELAGSVGEWIRGDLPPREWVGIVVANLIERWKVFGRVLRAMDVVAEHDEELRQFWARMVDPLVLEFAARIESEQRAGVALPPPPDPRQIAQVLAHMYWRAGHQASLAGTSASADAALVDTLTAVTVRAIYGAP